jgi:hypothetical protein
MGARRRHEPPPALYARDESAATCERGGRIDADIAELGKQLSSSAGADIAAPQPPVATLPSSARRGTTPWALIRRSCRTRAAPSRSTSCDVWNRLTSRCHSRCRTFLHALLVVEDKLSMAHGLEAGLPFLDNASSSSHSACRCARSWAISARSSVSTRTSRGRRRNASSQNSRRKAAPPSSDGAAHPRQGHHAGQAGLLGASRDVVPRREHRLRAAAPTRPRRGDLRLPRPSHGAHAHQRASRGDGGTAGCSSGRCYASTSGAMCSSPVPRWDPAARGAQMPFHTSHRDWRTAASRPCRFAGGRRPSAAPPIASG